MPTERDPAKLASRCTDKLRSRLYKAVRLHLAGRTVADISGEMGVSTQAVYAWQKHPVYRARLEELEAALEEDAIEELRLLRRFTVGKGRQVLEDLAKCARQQDATISEKVSVSKEMREWSKWAGATTGITETTRVELDAETEVDALKRISDRLRDAG